MKDMNVFTVFCIWAGVICTVAIALVTMHDIKQADACEKAGGHWLYRDAYCAAPNCVAPFPRQP